MATSASWPATSGSCPTPSCPWAGTRCMASPPTRARPCAKPSSRTPRGSLPSTTASAQATRTMRARCSRAWGRWRSSRRSWGSSRWPRTWGHASRHTSSSGQSRAPSTSSSTTRRGAAGSRAAACTTTARLRAVTPTSCRLTSAIATPPWRGARTRARPTTVPLSMTRAWTLATPFTTTTTSTGATTSSQAPSRRTWTRSGGLATRSGCCSTHATSPTRPTTTPTSPSGATRTGTRAGPGPLESRWEAASPTATATTRSPPPSPSPPTTACSSSATRSTTPPCATGVAPASRRRCSLP
mmetsp:Transcript_20592/g.55524  ORF Transcript_20592/g.55524 Transcript_20592/m.55524 type:complete len:298 (-) Transcript_20592:514-1407(-)